MLKMWKQPRVFPPLHVKSIFQILAHSCEVELQSTQSRFTL